MRNKNIVTSPLISDDPLHNDTQVRQWQTSIRKAFNYLPPPTNLEKLTPHISWLKPHISTFLVNPPKILDEVPLSDFFNILLVFAGARPSALPFLLISPKTLPRLNTSLEASGQAEFRLVVEESYVGDWIYRENCLFIKYWNHRETGIGKRYVESRLTIFVICFEELHRDYMFLQN